MWGLTGKPELAQPVEGLVVGAEPGPPSFAAGLVAVERQAAAGGDRRIDLAQRPRRRVAGVGEETVLALGLATVQLLEGREGEEHLAADLQRRRDALAPEADREVLDGADVRGDVLPGGAVAAGGAAHEATLLVEERDREAVELGLADVVDGAGDEPGDPLTPREELLAGERVVEREHRLEVGDLRERRRDPRRAGTPGGRVGGDEIGVLGLEVAQLAHEIVVLGVADLGIVGAVVPLVVVADGLAQLRDPLGHLLGRHPRKLLSAGDTDAAAVGSGAGGEAGGRALGRRRVRPSRTPGATPARPGSDRATRARRPA